MLLLDSWKNSDTSHAVKIGKYRALGFNQLTRELNAICTCIYIYVYLKVYIFIYINIYTNNLFRTILNLWLIWSKLTKFWGPKRSARIFFHTYELRFVDLLRSLMSPSTTWWMPTWFSLELWLWSLRVIHLSSPNCTTHFCPFRNGCTNGRRVSRCCGEEVYSMSFKDLNQRG